MASSSAAPDRGSRARARRPARSAAPGWWAGPPRRTGRVLADRRRAAMPHVVADRPDHGDRGFDVSRRAAGHRPGAFPGSAWRRARGDRSWKAPAQSTERCTSAAGCRSRSAPTATMPPAARGPAASGQNAIAPRLPSMSAPADAPWPAGWPAGDGMGQPDLLADPHRHNACAHRADQDGGHAGRAVPAHGEPVAEQPGRRSADQADKAVPAVRGDERGSLHVDHGGAARPGHDQLWARRQR